MNFRYSNSASGVEASTVVESHAFCPKFEKFPAIQMIQRTTKKFQASPGNKSIFSAYNVLHLPRFTATDCLKLSANCLKQRRQRILGLYEISFVLTEWPTKHSSDRDQNHVLFNGFAPNSIFLHENKY